MIQLLQKFGYQLLSPAEFYTQSDAETEIPFLDEVLCEQIVAFNGGDVAGPTEGFSGRSAVDAVNLIRSRIRSELQQGREWFHHTLGVGIEGPDSIPGCGDRRLRLVDWECVTANTFHLGVVAGATEAGIDRSEVRLLCYLNGLPIATIEFASESGFAGVPWTVLPCVVFHSALPCLLRIRLSDRGELLTDAAATGSYHSYWDDFERQNSCGEFIRRWPDARDHVRLLSYLHPEHHSAFERFSLQRREVLRDERCLWNLMRPERLLELIDCYAEFRQGEVLLASHREFLAVQAVVAHVRNSVGSGVQWVARRSGTNHYFAFLARAMFRGAIPDLVRLTLVSGDETLRARLSHWLARTRCQSNGGPASSRLSDEPGSVEILGPSDFMAIQKKGPCSRRRVEAGMVLIEQTSCGALLDPSVLHQLEGANETVVMILEHPPLEWSRDSVAMLEWKNIPGISWRDVRAGGALPLYWSIPVQETTGKGRGLAPKDRERFRAVEQQSESSLVFVIWDLLQHFASWVLCPGSEGWLLAGSKEAASEIWSSLIALDGVSLVDPVDAVFAPGSSVVIEFAGSAGRLILRSEPGKPLQVRIVGVSEPGLPDLVIVEKGSKLPALRKALSVVYVLGDIEPSVLGSLYGRMVARGEGKDWGMIVDFRWTRDHESSSGGGRGSRRRGVVDELFGAVDILGEVLPSLRGTVSAIEKSFSPLQWTDDRCEFEMILRDQDRRRSFFRLLEEYVRSLTLALAGGLLPIERYSNEVRSYRVTTLFLADLLEALRRRFGPEPPQWKQFDYRFARLARFFGDKAALEKSWRPHEILDHQRLASSLARFGDFRARGDVIVNNLRLVVGSRLTNSPFVRRRLLERVSELENRVDEGAISNEDYFWNAELLLDEARVELDDQMSNRGRGHGLAKDLGLIVGEYLNSLPGIVPTVSDFQLAEARGDYFKKGVEGSVGIKSPIKALKLELGRVVLRHQVASGRLSQAVKDRIRNDVDEVLFRWCRACALTLDVAQVDQLSERLISELLEPEVGSS